MPSINIIRAIAFFLGIFLCLGASAFAAEKVLETNYATVYSQSEEDLLAFGKKVGGSSASLVRGSDKAIAILRDDIDMIVFRVRTLLDMYPQRFWFSVRILKDYNEVKQKHAELASREKAPIAFYAHKSQTIYLSPDNISDRIFAHEVAHAVINAYFEVTPPAHMQEILAQYVDKHLWDE